MNEDHFPSFTVNEHKRNTRYYLKHAVRTGMQTDQIPSDNVFAH